MTKALKGQATPPNMPKGVFALCPNCGWRSQSVRWFRRRRRWGCDNCKEAS